MHIITIVATAGRLLGGEPAFPWRSNFPAR